MTGDILEGFILPPDKSILHRLLIIGSLTNAEIEVPLRSSVIADDIQATIDCLRALGVTIETKPEKLIIHGVGMDGWTQPAGPLDCKNSGTTARLLMGALCGREFTTRIVGDTSLSRRPMKRLASLLNDHFGTSIIPDEEDGLPLTINASTLHSANVPMPVSSAQIKSALMLAALQTNGITTITEPAPSRDHTERMLQAFGASVRCEKEIAVSGDEGIPLTGRIVYDVPGDISGAYYLIVAAILNKKMVKFSNVVLNPARIHMLELLNRIYSNISRTDITGSWNEPRGTISVYPTTTTSFSIHLTKEHIPSLIDELPLLAALAACKNCDLTVEGAMELRHKESDRLALIVRNLRAFGAEAQERGDGFVVKGSALHGATVEHEGDHRIAMSFAVLGSVTEGAVTIPHPSVVNVSFPGFFTELEKITGPGRIHFN